jgi:hypothetical protein
MRPRPRTYHQVAEVAALPPFEVSERLRVEAGNALVRAFDPVDNEWLDLWADAGSVDEVTAVLAPARAALAQGSLPKRRRWSWGRG